MAWGDVLTKTKPEPTGEVMNVHPDEVLLWRKEEFLHMKFPLATAKWLSRTRVDLHQMHELLNAGCEHSLAIKILEGTCYSGEDNSPYLRRKVAEEESE